MKKIVLGPLLLLLCAFCNANDNKELGIVPQPRMVKIVDRDVSFGIDASTRIVANKDAQKVAHYLQNKINSSTGFDIKIGKKEAGKSIVLKVDNKLNDNKEAYTLVSGKNKVTITGASANGLFWGVQTLLQILPPEIYASSSVHNVKWNVPSVEIKDEPYFTRYRGLHMDISRHFRTKEEIMETIDRMAMHKMNTLHLHFADDDGWRIESMVYPKLTTVGSIGNRSEVGQGKSYYLTQKEVKEIIHYANDRFIKLFPEVDMPGHMHAVIRSYPELASENDKREEKKVIRIDEKGKEFCSNILREIHKLFAADEFHLGFDEVNLGSKTDIYSDEEITAFANTMSTFVKEELNSTPILWDDAFEKGFRGDDCLIHWWRYGKIHWWSDMELTMDQKLQKLNQPYIMSPANYTYFDMKNRKGDPGAGWAGAISVAEIYAWDPFLDLVDYDKSKRHLAQGIICATWSEGIKTMDDFEERVYPRLAAMSEKCWAPDPAKGGKMPWESYRDNVLKKQLDRYDVLGIDYWSKDDPKALNDLEAKKK
ncbi:MAG: beta-N-acetylhexosaminidase [Carboxylicivirga sp.]|jgi:hexosaminidase|nr:beta-N-acetylhexosaminidase [Carboxylicivirga sp.]